MNDNMRFTRSVLVTVMHMAPSDAGRLARKNPQQAAKRALELIDGWAEGRVPPQIAKAMRDTVRQEASERGVLCID